MRVVQTPSFRKAVKRLRQNQKADLDEAIRQVVDCPGIGHQKLGDLSWLRVHKFRMVGQQALLTYEMTGPDEIILHDVGSHENFYRDLKAR
jgi:mRNA interferase YafQ